MGVWMYGLCGFWGGNRGGGLMDIIEKREDDTIRIARRIEYVVQ